MAINNKNSFSRPNGVFNTGKVLTLSVCHFVHDIYSSFLAPLLPLLVEKFSLTPAQAGFLSTIMQIPALFNPLIGLPLTYCMSAAKGLFSIPFILMLPKNRTIL